MQLGSYFFAPQREGAYYVVSSVTQNGWKWDELNELPIHLAEEMLRSGGEREREREKAAVANVW